MLTVFDERETKKGARRSKGGEDTQKEGCRGQGWIHQKANPLIEAVSDLLIRGQTLASMWVLICTSQFLLEDEGPM